MNPGDWSMILLTLAYVITTICILVSTRKQFKESNRPRVYADFRFQNELMYIVVKNMGERAAYNINIKFTPDINYRMGNADRSLNASPLMRTLLFLGPKEEIDDLLGMGFEVLPKQSAKEIKIDINYEGDKKEKYNEGYFCSLEAYSKRIYVAEKTINDIVSELKEMRGVLAKKSSS